jgi:ethanolamine permease
MPLRLGGGDMGQHGELKRVLKPVHLWAIAVGLVISGDYFGWNYGLGKGGPVGMIIATLVVTIMYVCFIFSYTELSTAIPNSGGPFAYARRALGPYGGYIAGFATVVEFVFAPPAIARAIGSYVHFRVPALGIDEVALASFVVFGAINVAGVGLAATFELIVTALAAFELFLFFFLTGPYVDTARIITDPLLPYGFSGVFAALPFGIWFYLAIEGVAMSAEETVNPKTDIPKGYIAGIITLVCLALGTLICTTGVVELPKLLEDDSPLPKALAAVLANNHPVAAVLPQWLLMDLMVYLGLFGLLASFHGIMMGYSRQVFALARAQYLPGFLADIHPRFKTPHWAVIVPGIVGAVSVIALPTDRLITAAGLGAVVLYIISMVSLFVLRRKEPHMERPFVAPVYPLFPAVALGLSVVFFFAFAASDWAVLAWFLGGLAVGLVIFSKVTLPKLGAEPL